MLKFLKELVRQLPCLVLGHDGKREGGHRELFLRCTRCLARSHGWQLPPAPTMKRLERPVPSGTIPLVEQDTILVNGRPFHVFTYGMQPEQHPNCRCSSEPIVTHPVTWTVDDPFKRGIYH